MNASRWILIMLLLTIPMTAASADEQKLYFNLGLAWADASYPNELSNLLDMVEALPAVDHVQVGIDLTLYFALKPGTTLGFSLNGIGDRYEDNSDHIQINQYLYAASFRYYPSGSTGEGLFVRGDLGLARMVIDSSEGDAASDTGTGLLMGGGYSFPISGGTWFSLNADYTTKSVEGETYGGITIGGAFLF